MKKIIISLFLFSVAACSAIPTPPVFHAHDGRIHKHSLPVEGIKHRHGNGQPGVIAKSTNKAGVISSTVIYQSPKVSNKNVNNFSISKGDITCKQGQSDCNICANNVQQQFNQAASGRLHWRTKPWRFSWSKKYPPFGKRPLDLFDGDPVYTFGIPDKHIQGFTRTNSARFPYVGSHNHKRKGGVFVIKQERDGKKYLATIYSTKSRNPSGVQVIGHYLVYGDGGNLIFRDLSSSNHSQSISIKIKPKEKYSVGGGLGLLKLSDNNLLLVTSGPGSQDSRPRYNYFYKVATRNHRPHKISYLNKSLMKKKSQWPKGLAFSENLSLITECGTGDIYSVHTTGDQKGIKAISGQGYWRLSKLNERGEKLSLTPINAFITGQNMTNCNVRAAATVFVNKRHQLEFNCHAYAKDPDGTLFNVLGRSNRGADKFYFRTGTLY